MDQVTGNTLLLPRVQDKDPTIATLKIKTNRILTNYYQHLLHFTLCGVPRLTPKILK